MGHIRRRLLVSVATLGLLGSVLAIGTVSTAAPAVAAGSFTTQGSIEQVYTWGHPVGSSVELHDGGNALVATGTADAQGAFDFRNVAPGTGYTVQEGGVTGTPVAVTGLNDNPSQSFYQGISLHEGYGYLP